MMMANKQKEGMDEDDWDKLAASSHQRRREAREAEYEAEMQRLETLEEEGEEDARVQAQRKQAWERTNHLMDFTRRTLLDDITKETNKEDSSEDESTGGQQELPRDALGWEMFLAQREQEDVTQGYTKETAARVFNVEQNGDGSFEDCNTLISNPKPYQV